MATVETQARPLGPDDVQAGDWLDVRDTTGAWCGYRVLTKTEEKVLLQRNARHELWLEWSSARLATFRSHSTNAVGLDRQPTSWEQTIAECNKCAAQLAVLEAALPGAGIAAEPPWTPMRLASILCGDVPDLVDRLLGQDYSGAGAAVGSRVLEANGFFLQFLRFFCVWLRVAPELLRATTRPVSSNHRGPISVCAAALTDLVATFGRLFGAVDRRSMVFFEANAGLPERHSSEAFWPGGEAGWLHAAVSKVTSRAKAATNVAMPLAWLLIKLRGLDDASAKRDGIDVSVFEEALRRLSLLNCDIAVFCAMGGVEGLLNVLAFGAGDDVPEASSSGKQLRVRPLAFEGVRALLLPLATTVALQNVAPSWIELTLPRILAGIRQRITGMWDDEVRTVDRDQLLRCLAEPAMNLLAAKCSRSELEELREELLLLFCRRRLQSPFLEKRLKALSDVKEVVDRVSPRATHAWSMQSLWGAGARERDSRKSGASLGEAGSASAPIPLLSPAGLARWIADDDRYGLLPILFGSRAHPEVLRRANFLLRLLAQEQLLTRDCLDDLWLCGCSADKHEGLKCCVLDLFVETAPSLDHSQIKFVVGKVVDMPAQSIDVKFVCFLRDFLLASVNTRRHVQATDDVASNGDSTDTPLGDGLAVFWQLLRAEAARDSPLASVSAAVAKQARACFLDLLRNSHFASHRNRHLQTCWKALHEGPADTSLVHLFREILDTFPTGSQTAAGRADTSSSDTASHIQREVVLLRLSKEEGQRQLSGFLLNCAINAIEGEPRNDDTAKGTLPSSASDSLPSAGPTQHQNTELVAAILDTLLYSLTESPLQIGLKEIERLWKSVSDAGCRELDMVAAWLSRVAGFTFAAKVFNRPHWGIWPESEYVQFFQKVLRSSSQTNFKCLSHDGLVCFVNYMKLCNMKLFSSSLQADMLYIPETPNYSGIAGSGSGYPGGSGGAHTYTPGYSQLVGRDGVPKSGDLATAVGKRFRVVRWGLTGNEELWEIAMLVEDAAVFESCSDFLVSCVVFLHPCSDLYRQRGDVHLVFLQRCMRILESPGDGSQGSERVHKVLALLAKFIHFTRLSASRNQTSAIWPVPTELERDKRERRSKQDLAASFHIMFRSDSGSDSMQQKTVYVPRSATLGCLRSRVAGVFQIQPREMGLYTCPGMQLLDWDLDCLTLDECQVASSLYAAYARPARQDQDGEYSSPLWQMSEKDLDSFLDLLAEGAVSSGFKAPVWAILGCFPVPQPIVGVLSRVAKWGLDLAGQTGRRPLAELLGDDRQQGHLEVHVPMPGGTASAAGRDLAAEFRKFWYTKVWSSSLGAAGERRPHTHRLLYTLRVIHSLMLGHQESTSGVRTGERLLLHPRGDGLLIGDAWSRGFSQAGGLELLLGVFAELHAVKDVHTLHCLSLLAHSIRELVEKLPDVSEAARSQQPGGNTVSGAQGSQSLEAALHGILPSMVPLLLESALRVVSAEYGTMEVSVAKEVSADEANRTEPQMAEPSSACYSAQVLNLCSKQPAAVDEVHVNLNGAGSPQVEASDASVCVSRIFLLLHVILRREPDCSMSLRGFNRIAELLQNGLLGLDSAVREATASGVLALCISDPSEDGDLSGILLTKLLFEVLPGWQRLPERSDQLFALIARLLQRHRSPQPAAMGLVPQPQPPAPRLDEMGQVGSKPPITELLDSLVMQLRTAVPGKKAVASAAEDQADTLLLGMLQLLHSILHCFPHLKGPVSRALATQLLRCCLGPAAASLSQVLPHGGAGVDDGDCNSAPRCRTSHSRQAAFALLHELATDSAEACLWVAQLLLVTCTSSSPRSSGCWRESDWVVHPDTGVQSATGFVGLKNLGATCYMNSVLQQLFAHSDFQHSVLQAYDEEAGSNSGATLEFEKPSMATESRTKSTSAELLYQLQVLFSSLRVSQRQYYTPHGFFAAFRDWEGRPVNVLQQMDADEFLSLLMDQLEKGMAEQSVAAPAIAAPADDKPTSAQPSSDETAVSKGKRTLLRKLFGGTFCTQIIPKASGAGRSERHEDFLVLSLQVKGKTSVRASLEAFVEGEMLEGDNAYYSEEQGCKVDALKRTCLENLPETLIIVLKRFEFDFDTMQKVKLNDFCEFPMLLDMWPYTKEALDGGSTVEGGGSKFHYVLRGIVLHSGTADSGHYSSLVKGEQSQWYEFNDTLVTPLSEDDIPQEAFGGLQHDDFTSGSATASASGAGGVSVAGGSVASSRGGSVGGGFGSTAMAPSRSKNAYLLFYDRATSSDAIVDEAVDAGVGNDHTGGGSSQDNTEAAAGESIQHSVEASNRQHWHTQAVFSVEFADFAWMFVTNFYSSPVLLSGKVAVAPQADTVGALKYMQLSQLRRDSSDQGQLSKLSLIVCNFAASFLFTIFVRSRDRHSLPEWCSLICRLLQRAGLPAQRWFGGLLASHGFLRETFLECPVPETRIALLAVVVQVLHWVYEDEAAALRTFTANSPEGMPRHGQQWSEKASLPEEELTEPGQPPLLARIWATLIELLPVARQPEAQTHFAQFFELIQEFIKLGPETLSWALKAGGLNVLLAFVLQDADAAAPLQTATANALRWYQPNWLRTGKCITPEDEASTGEAELIRPVSHDVLFGVGGKDNTPLLSEYIGDATNVAADSTDSSFERHLHSNSPGEMLELGPLWGVLRILLEQSPSRMEHCAEENEMLLRRLVRLGGITSASAAPASRLMQLFCKGDLGRSQGVICRICERIDESDGRALRGALRMGSSLVAITDAATQQRSVFLLKSVLHIAKNNRKYFRTMHFVIHYIVRWCRRRPELPQWLISEAGSQGLGAGQYRWLETWLKDNMSYGRDSWQNWQGGAPNPGNASMNPFRRDGDGQGGAHGGNYQDVGGSARYSWCSEMLPYVKKIARGEPLSREAAITVDSDIESPEASSGRNRQPGAALVLGVPRMQLPVLSKVQMVNKFAAADQRQQQQQEMKGMAGMAGAW